MTTAVADVPDGHVVLTTEEHQQLLDDQKFLEALLASGAEVKTTEDAPVENIADGIARLLNEHQNWLGSQLLGDWYLIAEVHGSDDSALRIISAGQSVWRSVGLLSTALMDLQAEALAHNVFGFGEDGEEEPEPA